MCARASDRQGRKDSWSEGHQWVLRSGLGPISGSHLRSRLEEPPVGREGETALEPSGRWEREPMLYLPSAV